MLRLAMCVLLVAGMVRSSAAQQASSNSSTATCSFQDGSQLTVRYKNEKISGKNARPKGEFGRQGGRRCSCSHSQAHHWELADTSGSL